MSPDVQLLAALKYYATGSFLQVLGDGLGLSKTFVSRAVEALTYGMLPLAAEQIQSSIKTGHVRQTGIR